MKTILILMLTVMFGSMSFAAGNNNGNNGNKPQSQAQQATAAALAIAAAKSEATNNNVIDMDQVNKSFNLNANLNKNDSSAYSEGSFSNSKSKALSGSKSRAGDNASNINISGDAADLVAANTAVASLASECVDSTAAQGIVAGFSTSGVNASCLARSISSWHLTRAQVLLAMPNCDKCAGYAQYSIEKSQDAAELANTNGLISATSKTRSFVTDMAWIIGAARLVAMGF